VLYAGRHIPDKQVESLPGAVRAAREQLPDLRLVILGDGPSSGAVRRAVADAGGEEWTEMPGFVEQEVLDTLMGDAACLVNPSRREGYGLVVVESSRYGTPVVLVEHEGNASTELVEEGTNGRIAPSASPEHLGSAIVDAVRGGDSLRNSTSAWYQQAVTTRTIRRTVEAILATIDAPVGQHPRKEQKP
jgi:glycosyltransferase involved in cell wall biosynthesis